MAEWLYMLQIMYTLCLLSCNLLMLLDVMRFASSEVQKALQPLLSCGRQPNRDAADMKLISHEGQN